MTNSANNWHWLYGTKSQCPKLINETYRNKSAKKMLFLTWRKAQPGLHRVGNAYLSGWEGSIISQSRAQTAFSHHQNPGAPATSGCRKSGVHFSHATTIWMRAAQKVDDMPQPWPQGLASRTFLLPHPHWVTLLVTVRIQQYIPTDHVLQAEIGRKIQNNSIAKWDPIAIIDSII